MTEAARNGNNEMVRTIGHRELFFLLHMLEVKVIAGVTDLYRGYLTDEREDEREQQQCSLLEAGLLIQKGDGLEVDPVMEAFIAVMESPYAMRLQIVRRGICVYDGYMHFFPEMVVERVEDKERKDAFRISAIANAQLAIMFLEHVFPADSAEGTHRIEIPFTLTEEMYDALLPDGDEPEADAQLIGAEAKQLKSMMDQAAEHGRLTLLERQGSVWRHEMLTYGMGAGGGWIATSAEENRVLVENYRRGKMGQAMKSFVKDLILKMEAEMEV